MITLTICLLYFVYKLYKLEYETEQIKAVSKRKDLTDEELENIISIIKRRRVENDKH